MDFRENPFLVIWETTRSCELACQHCRAEAILRRDPWELKTEEGFRLLDETKAMGTPIFIFSGGDPFSRPDLEELISHGKSLDLRLGTIPAAASNLTRERLKSVKAAGLDQLALSLDGPTAELHDGFRKVSGSFKKTLEAAQMAHEIGLPLQINTVFASWNMRYLEDMVALVRSLGVVFWEVFFLIKMGRGSELEAITAEQFETVFERLHRLSQEEKFVVKLTEAQHYRRFVIKKEKESGSASDASRRIRHSLAKPRGLKGSIGMSAQAVNAGKGIMFIDHVGNICPSGFLPIPVANIRRHGLAEVYREQSLFKKLRDPKLLKGKCSYCEFASICGGSRARAYAVTGDYLASDPDCAYLPPDPKAATSLLASSSDA